MRNKTTECASVPQCLETASRAVSAASKSFRVIVLRLKLAVNDAADGRGRTRGLRNTRAALQLRFSLALITHELLCIEIREMVDNRVSWKNSF